MRRAIHSLFQDANARATAGYNGDRQALYSGLKLEGILEAPQNLCVLCDPESRRGRLLMRGEDLDWFVSAWSISEGLFAAAHLGAGSSATASVDQIRKLCRGS